MPAKRKDRQLSGERITRNSPNGCLSKMQSPLTRKGRDARNSKNTSPEKKPVQSVASKKPPQKKEVVQKSSTKLKSDSQSTISNTSSKGEVISNMKNSNNNDGEKTKAQIDAKQQNNSEENSNKGHGNHKTRKRHASDVIEHNDTKYSKVEGDQSTLVTKEIMSPPRRSSRGVIPNRKYHDMDMDYTPNKRKEKNTEGSSMTAQTSVSNYREPTKRTKGPGKKISAQDKTQGNNDKDSVHCTKVPEHSTQNKEKMHVPQDKECYPNEPTENANQVSVEEKSVTCDDIDGKEEDMKALEPENDNLQESTSDQLATCMSTNAEINESSEAIETDMNMEITVENTQTVKVTLDPKTGELIVDDPETGMCTVVTDLVDSAEDQGSKDDSCQKLVSDGGSDKGVTILSSCDLNVLEDTSRKEEISQSEFLDPKDDANTVQIEKQKSDGDLQKEDSNTGTHSTDYSEDITHNSKGKDLDSVGTSNLLSHSSDDNKIASSHVTQNKNVSSPSPPKVVISKRIGNNITPHRPGILKAYKVKTIEVPVVSGNSQVASGQDKACVEISGEGETISDGKGSIQTISTLQNAAVGSMAETSKIEIIELTSSIKQQIDDAVTVQNSSDEGNYLPDLVTPDGSTLTVRKSDDDGILTIHGPSASSNKASHSSTIDSSEESFVKVYDNGVLTIDASSSSVVKGEDQQLTSISTQTPLSTDQEKGNLQSDRSLLRAAQIVVGHTRQQTEGEEGKKHSENIESSNATKPQEFVIVHLPEGQTVKRRHVKQEREENIPYVIGSDGAYVCCVCSYRTTKKTNWYKHKKKHHGVRDYKCPECSYMAATSSNLKRHINIHKDIRDYQCITCGQTFRQKIHLERHIKYKHEEKQVKCPLCDYMCANENPDLKIHIKRRHIPQDVGDGNIRAFTCEECGLITVSKKDLRQHMKFHKSGPELKLFCQLCSFVTDCESRLRRHMLSHTNERPFQCGLCDYRGSQKEHVLRHMRSQHQIEVERRQKKSEVENDDESDSRDSYEKRVDKSDYTSQEKIFACNHCSMKFAKLINLYKHLHAQHKDILPDESSDEFLCVVCEFKTTSKKNLLVHMRKHNMQDQVPPSHVYSCVLCRYMNPRRRNLFQHMKKKHGIEIVMKDDGSTSCFVADNVSISDESVQNILTVGDIVTATTEEPQLQIVTEESGSVKKDNSNLQNVISIEELAYAVSHPQPNTNSVVVVEQSEAQNKPTTNVQEHEAAEAIEGLQALAEQPGILQEVVADENFQVVEEVKTSKSTDGSSMETEVITMETTAILEDMGEKQSDKESTIQLSQEQLMSLSTGDYVEINGEMYKVEISTEDNPESLITVGQDTDLSTEIST